MKPLSSWQPRKLTVVFTDIDDTLTSHGQLHPEPYAALWKLQAAGVKVVPVTGRPAGWCEMIARFWPVDGVVGENGGFYFRYIDRAMKRVFFQDMEEQMENRKRLDAIAEQILSLVPGCAVASDQFTRLIDLAIDFAEDVGPLPKTQVLRIQDIFQKNGAQAKVSSIHVNGWFGDHDKLKMVEKFALDELRLTPRELLDKCTFVGDSPNDEPMFERFPLSFAVGGIERFQDQITHLPTYRSQADGGAGFVEIAERILSARTG